MRRRLSVLTAIAIGIAAPAAHAAPTGADLPALFKSKISSIKKKSKAPVLLPDVLAGYPNANVKKLYGTGATDPSTKGWFLDVSAVKNCGANACAVASFSGTPGGEIFYKTKVKLKGGVVGYYKPLTCGGSCSDPEIQFKRNGVTYEFSADIGKGAAQEKAGLIEAANEALAAGPR